MTGKTEPMNTIEISTGENPAWSVIFLHGLGADGHDFVPVAGELELPAAVRFIFPHAPIRPVTINGGLPMRAWYDILTLDWEGPEDEADIRAGAALLERLIEHEIERGIPSVRIILGGFSQGGTLVLHAGLRHPRRLAGIVALSTWLPLPDTLSAEKTSANRQLPVFMAHGTEDPTVPFSMGALSRDRLRAQGYRVDWRTYPMEHEVCAQEIMDFNDWLRARLRSPL